MSVQKLTESEDGGYRHVLRIALPMVLSTSSATIMSFVDRMFLGRYSSESLAAALTGGITCWAVLSTFLGTVSYAGTFAAQYYGAGDKDRVSAAVWQGVFFALASGAALAVLGANAGLVMSLAGHSERIAAAEATYFGILTVGAVLPLLSSALAGFYGGLGRTRLIMVAEVTGNAVNFVLDYALIFGKWGFPRWGIKGAAVATVTGNAAILLIYLLLLLFGKLGREYRMLRRPRVEWQLLRRLVQFGVPNGVGWTVDAGSWMLFVWFIGRIGDLEMQALSATFAINHLAFLPMVGFAAATSILVGQFAGASQPDLAMKATRTTFAMTFTYMTLIALVFVLFPAPLVRLFAPAADADKFESVVATATVLLRFVALYSVFDSGNLIYASALKGAGDTRFTMVMTLGLSLVILVIPTYLVVEVYEGGIYAALSFATAYVIILAAAFYLRYRAGAWKRMRVIETPAPPSPRLADGPMIDA